VQWDIRALLVREFLALCLCVKYWSVVCLEHVLSHALFSAGTGSLKAPCSGRCSWLATTGAFVLAWRCSSPYIHLLRPSALHKLHVLHDTKRDLDVVKWRLHSSLHAACKPCARSGHQSFSNNKTLNDFVGNIVHSSILVPYHGWRISHR
jgi:hypothetical protein